MKPKSCCYKSLVRYCTRPGAIELRWAHFWSRSQFSILYSFCKSEIQIKKSLMLKIGIKDILIKKTLALTLNNAGFSIVAEAGEGRLWGFTIFSTPHDPQLRAHLGNRLLTYHLPSVTQGTNNGIKATSHALHHTKLKYNFFQ